MRNLRISTGLLILIFGSGILTLVGCSGTPSQPTPIASATPPQYNELPPTQTPIAAGFNPTLTAVPTLPGETPTALEPPAIDPAPTPAAVTVVYEENGWVTYRNEVIGYEINVPAGYTVRGASPYLGGFRPNLLGPAVPDEEILHLLSRYYGDSLYVSIHEPDNSGKLQPWGIWIYAQDIIVNDLGGVVSPGGMGDYQVTLRQETLQIDWQMVPVQFMVTHRDQQPVGELAMVYLEKDGIAFHFGYVPPKDDPAAYQTYLVAVWPEIRKIVESYKKLPKNTSLSGMPAVNAASITNASPQAIAQTLFEQYLTAYQENPLDRQARLDTYRIGAVEIPVNWQSCAEQNNAEFIAKVTYAVKPAIWPPLPPWDTAGYATFDQWIVRINATMAVYRTGQEYIMKILYQPVCTGSASD